MLALLLSFFLPIISGFLTLSTLPPFKYRFQKATAERMILWPVICGLALYLFAYYLIAFDEWLFLQSSCLSHFILQNIVFKILASLGASLEAPFRHIPGGTNFDTASVLSFILVLLSLFGFSVWRKRCKKSYDEYVVACKQQAVDHATDIVKDAAPLEELFQYSLKNFEPIILNLKSRKVYIGIVTKSDPVLSQEGRKHVQLLPVASGYRDKDDLHFHLENDYKFLKSAYKALSTDVHDDTPIPLDKGITIKAKIIKAALQHSLVIKTDDIVSGGSWLKPIYKLIQEQRPQKENAHESLLEKLLNISSKKNKETDERNP